MLRIVTLLACFACVALPAAPSLAQDPTDCDKLTAQEALPAEADVNAAVAACEVALAAQPGEPRIVYQYALALERAGRVEDALRMYEWSAADGYGPAIEAASRLKSATAEEPAWTEAERATLGDSMAGISAAMRRFENELPPDPSDPLTIIAEIGTDPAAITEWVATKTRLIPYAGSLRGARGVLSDRSGNSLDRALALAALLSAAGEDVRLARATLSETQAAQLLKVSQGASVQIPTIATPTSDEALELFQSSGVPADLAKAAIDQAIEQRKQVEATVTEQTSVLVPLLRRSIEAAEASANAALERLAIQQLRDHFWVQVQRGAAWVDYHPDVDQVGSLTAAELLTPDTVPDLLRHAVTLRIIVEIQSASGRRQETLLSWTGFTASQGDVLVTLSHTTDTLAAISQVVATNASREQFLATVDKTSAWTPLLRVGDQVYFDKVFTRDGQVRTVDPNVFTQAGRGAGSAFGEAGELLGSDAAPSAEVGVPTAEWIEIELVAPGQPPTVARRTLFDLLGPAQRASNITIVPSADQLRDRALRLAGTSDILILGASPSGIQLVRAATTAIAEAAETLQAIALQPEPPEIGDIREGPRLVLPLRQFALDRLAGEALPAISAPNVFMFHQRFVWGSEGEARAQAEIDIVFNDTVSPVDMFLSRVSQGVRDTVLEGALIGDGSGTAKATALDLARGQEWTLLQQGDARLDALAPDLRMMIESDLAAGYSVLASLDPNHDAGWWRIEPTGRVLGMLPTGGGASMTEYALLAGQGITGGLCFFIIGNSLASGNASGVKVGGVLCAVYGGAFGLTGLVGGLAFPGFVGAALILAGSGAFAFGGSM